MEEKDKAISDMRCVSEAFYQGRIRDGLNGMEEMVGAALGMIGEDQRLVWFLDAVDARDYVLAADIIEYEIIRTIGEKA